MNIAFLTASDYPWRSGGVNQALHNLATHLGASGHQVDVITLENFAGIEKPMFTLGARVRLTPITAPALGLRDVPVVGTVATISAILRFPRRAVSTLDHAAPPDVIVADFTCAGEAIKWGRVHGVPVAVLRWAHWASELSQTSRGFGLMSAYWRRREQEVFDRAPLIVVDGPDLLDDARADGVGSDRLCLVPGSVDTKRFSLAAADPAALHRFGLSGRRLILFPSMLRDIKGFDHLLKAFAHLPVELRDSCSIVATGRENQAPYRALADELGIASQVVLLGEVSGEELPSWFAAADVAVFPYLFGAGYSVAGIEAMAAGLPLVAYDVQAFGSIVTEGETGRLVPTGDVRGLATAIESMLADEAARSRMGANARLAAAQFDIAEVGSRFESILVRMVEGEPPCA